MYTLFIQYTPIKLKLPSNRFKFPLLAMRNTVHSVNIRPISLLSLSLLNGSILPSFHCSLLWELETCGVQVVWFWASTTCSKTMLFSPSSSPLSISTISLGSSREFGIDLERTRISKWPKSNWTRSLNIPNSDLLKDMLTTSKPSAQLLSTLLLYHHA